MISKTRQWKALAAHAKDMASRPMRALFAGDEARFERYSSKAAGLFLDYSKNKIVDETLRLLIGLARDAGVEEARAAMFAGEAINETEKRAVLHVALRAAAGDSYAVDGEDAAARVLAEREKMRVFCQAVHSGRHKGRTGEPLDTVVNIGIGGSDLGPAMVCEALKPYAIDGRRTFFVSNVDGTHLAEALRQVDVNRTLFLIASKSFATEETMANAAAARDWFLAQGADEGDIARHFAAMSTNISAAQHFGIDPANVFQFWDWVGGRYSLWSAIGLSIALFVGFDKFEKLLAGAREMDVHFRDAPLEENLPVLLALIGVWNRNFLGCSAHAVIPYDQYLHRFPAYLQQADMESNGKSVTMAGAAVGYATGPVIFGEPGANAQHSFFQLLHQGTDVIPVDFILPTASHNPTNGAHDKLMANCLAQAEALMRGKSEDEIRAELAAQGLDAAEIDRLAAHRTFPGDRPSNMIVTDKMTPERLGALIALYEHKIFVQGRIWGVNSFDQWGVELGKQLAKKILPELSSGGRDDHDSSTKGLIELIKASRV